ncbi:hypothetical protein HNR39_002071 [Glaciimonas immobilis]|uniref:Uncharacterized protein n=1 Tax=Glaciimonas immobilis TaxID=728004 RepID=A0A840RTI2_9BURK|nr:hypothetical protein [Glaciimonas immobilis]
MLRLEVVASYVMSIHYVIDFTRGIRLPPHKRVRGDLLERLYVLVLRVRRFLLAHDGAAYTSYERIKSVPAQKGASER